MNVLGQLVTDAINVIVHYFYVFGLLCAIGYSTVLYCTFLCVFECMCVSLCGFYTSCSNILPLRMSPSS